MTRGSRVRLKQPKLPEGIWEITIWDPPTSFEYRQQSRGMTTVADHRVDALEGDRSRLNLRLEMRGLLVPMAMLFKGMTNRYMTTEAQAIKQAAESPDT
jgi:hypothetical protein